MVIKTEKGVILNVYFQQYTIGLYVCFYEKERLYTQFGVNTTKENFIKSLHNNPYLTVL